MGDVTEDLSTAGWKAVLSAMLWWLREEQLRGRIVEKGKVGSLGSRGRNAEVKEMGGGQCRSAALLAGIEGLSG
jgi:hypothetical protein